MRRSSRTPEDEEPSLFDLPLETDRASRAERPAASDDDPLLPLGPPPAVQAPRAVQAPKPAAPRPAPKPAPVARLAEPEDLDAAEVGDGAPAAPAAKNRLLAGAADLLVHA